MAGRFGDQPATFRIQSAQSITHVNSFYQNSLTASVDDFDQFKIKKNYQNVSNNMMQIVQNRQTDSKISINSENDVSMSSSRVASQVGNNRRQP